MKENVPESRRWAQRDNRPGPDPLRPPRPGNPETLQLYARDWTAIETWYAGTRWTPLPADPATVVAILTEAEAAPCPSAGALVRRATEHASEGSAIAPSVGLPRTMRAEPWPASPGGTDWKGPFEVVLSLLGRASYPLCG